jgi:hypothetical protein
VIRRVFWLTVGAAGGIMGYRRVAALGKRISGRSTTRQRPSGHRLSERGAAALGLARWNAAQGSAARRGAASRSLSLGGTIRATRAVRSFSRDVREGMELYSVRRPRAVGPTLPASNNNDVTVKDDR